MYVSERNEDEHMNMWKRFGVGALSAVIAVSSFVFVPAEQLEAAVIQEINWALGRDATANDEEAD